MQPNKNSLMLVKDNNALDYFIHHNKKKYPLGNKGPNVKKNQRDLVGKSSNKKSIKNILPRRTP